MPNSKGPNNKDEIYQKLNNQLKSISIASREIEPNKMTITTYHSSKGLECKVCLLLNVDSLTDKKLLYVGMTRASEKLCVHSFSPSGVENFKELLSCYEEMIAPIRSDMLTTANFDSAIEEEKISYVENIRKKYPNAYKPWGKREESELIELYNSGKEIEEIVESLGRQKGGVTAKLKKLGVVSNNTEPAKKNFNDETEYPVKSEHLIENDLWKENKKSRSIELDTREKNIEELTTSPVVQKGSIRSTISKLGSFLNRLGYGTNNKDHK